MFLKSLFFTYFIPLCWWIIQRFACIATTRDRSTCSKIYALQFFSVLSRPRHQQRPQRIGLPLLPCGPRANLLKEAKWHLCHRWRFWLGLGARLVVPCLGHRVGQWAGKSALGWQRARSGRLFHRPHSLHPRWLVLARHVGKLNSRRNFIACHS